MQLVQKTVALDSESLPVLTGMDQCGVVGKNGKHGGFCPREFVRTTAEISPCRSLEADHISTEGGVGGIKRQDLLLAQGDFQPDRKHHLNELFPQGSWPSPP